MSMGRGPFSRVKSSEAMQTAACVMVVAEEGEVHEMAAVIGNERDSEWHEEEWSSDDYITAAVSSRYSD